MPYNETTPQKGKIMDEDTVVVEIVEEAPKRSSLARKVLITTGVVVGIIIAGGFAYVRSSATEEECGCDVPPSENPTSEQPPTE